MSNRNTTVNRKKSKRKARPVVSLFMLGLFTFGCVLIALVIKEVYTTFDLWQSIEDTEIEFENISDENDYLTAQRDKLKDPNYVEDYARGNYMLSRDGETIFYLPSDENKPSE